jgi:penicillin-insensitive murein DD-endopeptidase
VTIVLKGLAAAYIMIKRFLLSPHFRYVFILFAFYLLLTKIAPHVVNLVSIYPPSIIEEKRLELSRMLSGPVSYLVSEEVLQLNTWYVILVFLWYYLLVTFIGLGYLFLRRARLLKAFVGLVVVALTLLRLFPNSLMYLDNDKPSISHGTPWLGSLENGKRMPFQGNNFHYFNFLSYIRGFCFVHHRLQQTIFDAYKICETTSPGTRFVLGEGSKRRGGTYVFNHASHRNGLSVDFMTPLLRNGETFTQTTMFNAYGYGYNFDEKGELDHSIPINFTPSGVKIDFEATARHILALDDAAKQNGLEIDNVVFKDNLRPLLFATSAGKELLRRDIFFLAPLNALQNQAHDDHFHIDFRIKH